MSIGKRSIKIAIWDNWAIVLKWFYLNNIFTIGDLLRECGVTVFSNIRIIQRKIKVIFLPNNIREYSSSSKIDDPILYFVRFPTARQFRKIELHSSTLLHAIGNYISS